MTAWVQPARCRAIAWRGRGGNASEFITLEYGLSQKWVGIPYQPLEPKEGKFGGW
jgi:hypothetical protein